MIEYKVDLGKHRFQLLTDRFDQNFLFISRHNYKFKMDNETRYWFTALLYDNPNDCEMITRSACEWCANNGIDWQRWALRYHEPDFVAVSHMLEVIFLDQENAILYKLAHG